MRKKRLRAFVIVGMLLLLSLALTGCSPVRTAKAVLRMMVTVAMPGELTESDETESSAQANDMVDGEQTEDTRAEDNETKNEQVKKEQPEEPAQAEEKETEENDVYQYVTRATVRNERDEPVQVWALMNSAEDNYEYGIDSYSHGVCFSLRVINNKAGDIQEQMKSDMQIMESIYTDSDYNMEIVDREGITNENGHQYGFLHAVLNSPTEENPNEYTVFYGTGINKQDAVVWFCMISGGVDKTGIAMVEELFEVYQVKNTIFPETEPGMGGSEKNLKELGPALKREMDSCLDLNYKNNMQNQKTQGEIESDTIQWFNATYAIWGETNRMDINLIGCLEANDAETAKYILDISWGIKNREDAIETLNRMICKEKTSNYALAIEELESVGLLERSEAELEKVLEAKVSNREDCNKLRCAYRAYHAYGERGVDAWDYCRGLELLGLYYVAGYYTLDEAMDCSLILAKALQEEFFSWQEMAGSYLAGYSFWKGEDAEMVGGETYQRRQEYEKLANQTDGPYTLDWNMPLKDTWSK